MGYPQEMIDKALVRTSSAFDTAEVLTAANAVYGTMVAMKRMTVQRMTFFVSTAITAGTQAPQVALKRRPTYNSTTGNVTLAVMTIPTGTAAGKVIYKDFSPAEIKAGEELAFEQVTQATDGGTAAGAGFYGVVGALKPEVPAAESNMIASS